MRRRLLVPRWLWPCLAILSAAAPIQARDQAQGRPLKDRATQLERAADAIRTGDLKGAESRLRSVLAISADDPPALDLLGVVLARTGRLQDAEASFRAALAQDPSLVGPHQNLARLYLMSNDEPKAVDMLRRAARLGRLDRDLGSRLARVELAAGNVEAAVAQLELLAANHDSVNARFQLSRIYAGQGQSDRALETARKALEQAPSSEDLLALYARTALAARQPALALRPLAALIRMAPDEADYPYLLGVARMQVGQLPEAEEVLTIAISQRPDHLLSHVALGMTLNRAKGYDRAASALDRALQLDPNSVEALAALAETNIGLDSEARAEELAERALSLDSRNALAKLVLGMVRMGQGRFAEARDALEQSVAEDPRSAKAHYQLSLALARLGDRDASQRHRQLYQKALEASTARLLELRGMAPTEDSSEAAEGHE